MRVPLLTAMLALPALASAQTTVYSNDFETGPLGAEWSGAGSRQSTGGLSAFGFGQQHLKNDGQTASILSLGGLGAHTSMTLAFDLAMWDSIDLGDTFAVTVDGVDLFRTRNVGGTWFDAFSNYGTAQCEGPGTRISGAFSGDAPNYGYGFWRDCARRVSFTFAHSAATAVFSWQFPNAQGGSDESFGIDNVVVTTTSALSSNTIPEPQTYALMATGLAALALVGRRRATRTR